MEGSYMVTCLDYDLNFSVNWELFLKVKSIFKKLLKNKIGLPENACLFTFINSFKSLKFSGYFKSAIQFILYYGKYSFSFYCDKNNYMRFTPLTDF